MVIRAGKMAQLLQLREMAEQMCLQGQEAVAFVREQQEIGRGERRLQRERQREADDWAREEAQHNREEAARQREHELALRQLDN